MFFVKLMKNTCKKHMKSVRVSHRAQTRILPLKNRVIHRKLWITFYYENGCAEPFESSLGANVKVTYPQMLNGVAALKIRCQ